MEMSKKKEPKKNKNNIKKKIRSIVFLGPSIIGVIVFFIAPFMVVIY